MAVSVGLMVSSLSSCIPVYKTTIAENKITVPVSLFEKEEMQIIRAAGYSYDIALQKGTGETYTALLLQCTHADNPLKSTGTSFVCDLHGSTYDKAGAVTKGPAARPLQKLIAEKKSDQIIILL